MKKLIFVFLLVISSILLSGCLSLLSAIFPNSTNNSSSSGGSTSSNSGGNSRTVLSFWYYEYYDGCILDPQLDAGINGTHSHGRNPSVLDNIQTFNKYVNLSNAYPYEDSQQAYKNTKSGGKYYLYRIIKQPGREADSVVYGNARTRAMLKTGMSYVSYICAVYEVIKK